MSNKISDTLNLAGGNLARPTRFSALIAPPPGIVTDANSRVFDVLCKSVQIPEINMEPIEFIVKGHSLKIPGRVNQEQSIELTMYLDEYHNLRQLFSDWIAGMDPRYYATTNPSSSDIAKRKVNFGNLIIKTRDFNETTSEPMNYLFEGVYPTSVSGPNFDGADVGAVTEITVTLAFYRFLSKDTSGNADDLDEYLSVFGLTASGVDGLGQIGASISAIGNGISAANSAVGAVTNTLTNIF